MSSAPVGVPAPPPRSWGDLSAVVAVIAADLGYRFFFPFHVGMRRVSASSAEGAVLCLAQWKAAGYK